MTITLKERVLKEANIIIDTNTTLRELAQKLNISKSTIHKDMQTRLKQINEEKYYQVLEIFSSHIKERHIKGGEATKKKYMIK